MVNSAGSTANVKELFEFLEKGKQIEFFNLWETIIPLAVKNRSSFKHLTFYIHVYFIVQKLKSLQNYDNNETPDDVDPLDMFKNYLWTNGSYFSSDVEFVPYFVLPFVRDLDKSKMFSDLFQDTWEIDFKKRLRTFIAENRNSHERAQIEMILYNDDSNKHDFVHWKTQCNDISKKFNHLYKDTEALTGLIYELITVLRKYVLGEEVDLRLILNNCYKINPSLFNENSLQDQKHDTIDKETLDEDVRVFTIRDLDVEKIKTDLFKSSIKMKLLILQALRWGITKTSPDESSSLIWLIVNYDILHLMSGSCDFIKDMLMPDNVNTPHPTQQTAARLINALATFKLGQNYLASFEIVELIMRTLLYTEFVEIDEVTTSMLVAALQKLSSIHCIGEHMIKLNIIEWLLKKMVILEEWNYFTKRCLLLLMSLSRYRNGQQSYIELSNNVIQFSTKFLSGGYKGSESCESIFWKFCVLLENIFTRLNVSLEERQTLWHSYHSNNIDILHQYNQNTQERSNIEPQIDADDPLKVEPNGMAFLRLNYKLLD